MDRDLIRIRRPFDIVSTSVSLNDSVLEKVRLQTQGTIHI